MPKLRLTFKVWPVVTVVAIGLSFLTQAVAGWFGIELKDQANIALVQMSFRNAFVSWKHFGVCAINVALLLVICPVLEELVFRGLIFKGGSRYVARLARRAGPAVAVVSSVLFSAAHYIMQPWPDNAFVALFFFGLAQCWLYRRTDRIWCPILNHALFNLTSLALLFLLYDK